MPSFRKMMMGWLFLFLIANTLTPFLFVFRCRLILRIEWRIVIQDALFVPPNVRPDVPHKIMERGDAPALRPPRAEAKFDLPPIIRVLVESYRQFVCSFVTVYKQDR